MSGRWSAGEMEFLREMVANGCTVERMARELGRSEAAITVRTARHFKAERRSAPAWKGSPLGNVRWWTEERTLEGLQDFASKHKQLPTSDHEYSRLKKGHMEWPPAARVLEFHGSMPAAWAAVGRRVSRSWVPWSQEDDDYLLGHAGEQTLKRIAKHLDRTWAACKRRLYDLGAGRARDVSGRAGADRFRGVAGCAGSGRALLADRPGGL